MTSAQSAGRMLKIEEVAAETSLSRRTIYRLIRAGQFPPSRKLSPQRVAWPSGEVEAWKQGLSHNQGGLTGGPNQSKQ